MRAYSTKGRRKTIFSFAAHEDVEIVTTRTQSLYRSQQLLPFKTFVQPKRGKQRVGSVLLTPIRA